MLTFFGISFIFASALVITVMILVISHQFKSIKRNPKVIENIEIHVNRHYLFGIDVSHYQELIDWDLVRKPKHPIEFVFIRSTMGEDGVDLTYKRNLKEAQKQGFLVGTYHFYRPNENSHAQFENFKKHAKVEKGHLVPVLDIESESAFGVENLRKGLQNFLNLAEREYGVKPIIYSGLDFWRRNLKGHFDEYSLWIAAYSGKHRIQDVVWDFHQFTDQVRVQGINGYVDGNDFNGSLEKLKEEFLVD